MDTGHTQRRRAAAAAVAVLIAAALAAAPGPAAAQTTPTATVDSPGDACAGSQVVSTQEVCVIPYDVATLKLGRIRTTPVPGQLTIDHSFVHVLPANVDPAHITDNADGTNASESQEVLVEGSDPPATKTVDVVCGRPYATREKLNVYGSYTKVRPFTGDNDCRAGQVGTPEENSFIVAPTGLSLVGGTANSDRSIPPGTLTVNTFSSRTGTGWTIQHDGTDIVRLVKKRGTTRIGTDACAVPDPLPDPLPDPIPWRAESCFRMEVSVHPIDGAYEPFCSGDYGYFRGIRPGETEASVNYVCYQIHFEMTVAVTGGGSLNYRFWLRENSNGPTSVPWIDEPPPGPYDGIDPCYKGTLRPTADPDVWERLDVATWGWVPCHPARED